MFTRLINRDIFHMSVFCELSCKKEDKAMNLHIFSQKIVNLMPTHNRLVINSSPRCTCIRSNHCAQLHDEGMHIDGTLDNI